MNPRTLLAILAALALGLTARAQTPLGPYVTANLAGQVDNPANFAAANAGALFAAAGVTAITNPAPGVNKYWGTDGSGARGYFTLPSSGGNGDMLRSTYDANTDGVVDLAAAVAWASITSKPSTFAPSAHTHPASEISDATAAGRAILMAADAAAQRVALSLGGAALLSVGTTAGTVAAGDDSRIVGAAQTSRSLTGANSITGGGTLAADRTFALVNDSASPGANKVYGTDGSGVRGWKSDPVGGGGGDMVKSTYDTNNNGVVDSADAIAWASVTGKPSTFTPASHTHPATEISDSTAAGRALLTAADAAAQRTALGLGTAATSAASTFATAVHNHAAADITSGTMAAARLGSGTANSTTYLRGDGTWATPSGGGTFDTNANYALAGSWTFTGPVSFAGTNTAELELFDADASASVTLRPADTTTQSYRVILPATAGTGFLRGTVSGSTNLTLSTVDYGTSSGTVMQGNDSRVVGAVQTTRTVTGANSISGGGDLSADRTLALVNDSGSPGANKVYGTDGSGVKGWKNDPAGGGGGSTTNWSTGATASRAAAGNYALRMADANGGFEWGSFLPHPAERKMSYFTGGSSTIGNCGIGELWTASGGSLAIFAGTSSKPGASHTQTAASVDSDTAINVGGQKIWFPGKTPGLTFHSVGWFDVTNGIRCWRGLAGTTHANMNGSATPNYTFAAFRYDSTTDQTWKFVTADAGGAWTVTDTGVVAEPSVPVRLSFVEDTANSRWLGVVNGTIVATNTATLPTSSMGPMMTLRSLDGTAKTNFVSSIVVSGKSY